MRTATKLAWKTARSLNGDHATSFAAAIAYYALFSIFPLVLFFISFSGYFITNAQRNSLVDRLAAQFGQAQAAEIYRQVQTATNGRAGLGILGLLTGLWSASSVFTAVRTGLNVVWHKDSGRPWYVAKLFDLLGVFVLSVIFALALAAVILLTRLEAVAHRLIGPNLGGLTTFAFALVVSAAPVLIVFLTFWLLYTIASPPHITRRHAAVGAVAVAVGFELLSLGFGLYVRYIGKFDKVYGSLGTMIAFLVYAYLVGLLILAGGELVEQYRELRSGPIRAAERAAAAVRRGTPVL